MKYTSDITDQGYQEKGGFQATPSAQSPVRDASKPAVECRSASPQIEGTWVDSQDLPQASQLLVDAHEQLLREEKLALVGQLAAGMDHDLRNPLGAIKNAVYYLKRKLADSAEFQANPKILEFFNIVDDEIGRTDHIITDLIGLARVGPSSFSTTDLGAVLVDAAGVAPFREGVEVEISTNDRGSLISVEADALQLRGVFGYLIVNAQEAMPHGGSLRLSATRSDTHGQVMVADNGDGIDPLIIKRIFDPMFTTKVQATGLGLSVCQHIVGRHGGTITATSQEGQGATFTVRLPLSPSPDSMAVA